MNLFFLRHAKAHSRGPKFRPDSKRTLTPQGEDKMYDVARGIKKLRVKFDLILTSPYVRAFRTAEILVEVYKSKKMFVTNNLTPEANPEDAIKEISENFASMENIVLVGHEPYLSRLISVLLTGGPDTAIDFKKAGLCSVTIKDLRFGKCASLNWLLKPGQLAALA